MIQVEVLLFAAARDLANSNCVVVELPAEATVAQLRTAVLQQHPSLAPLLDTCRIAADGEFVGDGATLDERVEIALIPPVSGG